MYTKFITLFLASTVGFVDSSSCLAANAIVQDNFTCPISYLTASGPNSVSGVQVPNSLPAVQYPADGPGGNKVILDFSKAVRPAGGNTLSMGCLYIVQGIAPGTPGNNKLLYKTVMDASRYSSCQITDAAAGKFTCTRK